MNFETFVQRPKKELDEIETEITRLQERISDLRKKADQLAFTIEYNTKQIQKRADGEQTKNNGPYAGLKVIAASVLILDSSPKPMPCSDITQELMNGGFETTSKKPNRYIYVALRRESMKDNPEIVKKGSLFGRPSHFEEAGGPIEEAGGPIEEAGGPKFS